MQPLHSYFRQLAICEPRLTSKFTTLDTLTGQIHLAVKTKNDPNIFKELYLNNKDRTLLSSNIYFCIKIIEHEDWRN